MAAFLGVAQTAEIALSAATTKTVVQIVAPANHRLRIKRWSVTFDGISATAEPVQCELLRQTTAGTMSALTPVPLDDSLSETLLTTAQHTATVEPTASSVLDSKEVHPQGGYDILFPEGLEPICGGADRVGIRCTAPAAVNVRGLIWFEE